MNDSIEKLLKSLPTFKAEPLFKDKLKQRLLRVSGPSLLRSFLPYFGTIFAVLFLAIGGYIFFAKPQLQREQTSNPAFDSSRSLGAPEMTQEQITANWKTYTNAKYNYSLKYPDTWEINRTLGSPPELTDAQLAQQNYVSFFDPNVTNEPGRDARRDISVSVWIQDQDAKPLVCSNLNDCMTQIHYAIPEEGQVENVQVAGTAGKKITYSGREWERITDVLVFMNGHLFQFELVTQTSEHSSILPVLEQILSTFRFL